MNILKYITIALSLLINYSGVATYTDISSDNNQHGREKDEQGYEENQQPRTSDFVQGNGSNYRRITI